MTKTYKLLIAYDGTDYAGWQVQPNGIGVQQLIQAAMKTILREEVLVTGSGRTDAGVHAEGQVAHFHWDQPIDLYRLLGSLNALLPADIRIKEVVEVPQDFHARYSAAGKEYHYHLWLDPVVSPFQRRYCHHVREKTDLSKLEEAVQYFLGTHDFSAFANEAHTGCAAHDPVRTLKRLDLVHQEGGLRLELEGDGFLYKMVRNIVGTLLEVGRGKRTPADIKTILASQDRRQAGMSAPAHGLFLVRVYY